MSFQEDVTRLVAAAAPHVGPGNAPLAQRIHAYLWPFVASAAQSIAAEQPDAVEATPAVETAPAPRDRRTRRWLMTVRFWSITENGPELVAEADPEVIDGTGELPGRVEQYGLEFHGAVPPYLSAEAVKEKLPQLRNNLGRQGSAVLRIQYEDGGGTWLCQTDVIRLND